MHLDDSSLVLMEVREVLYSLSYIRSLSQTLKATWCALSNIFVGIVASTISLPFKITARSIRFQHNQDAVAAPIFLMDSNTDMFPGGLF